MQQIQQLQQLQQRNKGTTIRARQTPFILQTASPALGSQRRARGLPLHSFALCNPLFPMNGVGSRRAFGIESEASPFQDVLPTGRAMANGYRQDIVNGFEAERPRYNPSNTDHPQSSPNVDLKDPIQVHLLTETALSDSREWVILSQEEVDDLKKQCQSIVQRIEQTRANLAIQSKYRDAAISMAKLYSPGKRRSILSDTSGDRKSVV